MNNDIWYREYLAVAAQLDAMTAERDALRARLDALEDALLPDIDAALKGDDRE